MDFDPQEADDDIKAQVEYLKKFAMVNLEPSATSEICNIIAGFASAVAFSKRNPTEHSSGKLATMAEYKDPEAITKILDSILEATEAIDKLAIPAWERAFERAKRMPGISGGTGRTFAAVAFLTAITDWMNEEFDELQNQIIGTTQN